MITLRRLREEDAKMIFEWRNSDFIKNLGSQQREVSWEEHKKWVEEAVQHTDNLIVFVIEVENKAIGQLTFKKAYENTYVISIYLLKEYIGQGLGTKAINSGIEILSEKYENISVAAFVIKTNLHSQRAFEKANFIRILEAKSLRINIPNDHYLYMHSNKKKIPHNRLTFGQEEIDAISRVVATGYWAGGKKVQEVEKKLCELTQRKYSILVSSGLSALRLSLLALDIKKNDEVLMPAYCCVALVNAVLSVGATPIPVDISPIDFNITDENINQHISDKTKAIIGVNTFGNPISLKIRKNIAIIEDCAHGLLKANMGNKGQISISSFYATKFVGSGEGGVVMTDDSEIAEFVRDWRDYTDKKPSAKRLNDKMSDLEAAILATQLHRIEDFIIKREEVARRYYEMLKELEQKYTFFSLPKFHHDKVWYRFPIRVRIKQKEFVEKVSSKNVGIAKPIENWLENEIEKFPNAKAAYEEVISLPIYPTLRLEEQELVIKVIMESLNHIHNE
ncbi:MAG: GNAT family N-acetyltransferase [Thermonemataceae bacterium]|nr:GNAT family N-acetyltransferase [Thermonemataceae bacterium]